MKYHFVPLWLMAAVLPGAALTTGARADVIVIPQRRVIAPPQVGGQAPGRLVFSVEPHPGYGNWTTCSLSVQGTFMVQPEGMPMLHGVLGAKECGRILEEFEKLCKAAGEERFIPVDPRAVGLIGRIGAFKRIGPYFSYTNAQGKQLELAGAEKLPPPEVTAFLRLLWQKMLFHYAKNEGSNFHAHPSLR